MCHGMHVHFRWKLVWSSVSLVAGAFIHWVISSAPCKVLLLQYLHLPCLFQGILKVCFFFQSRCPSNQHNLNISHSILGWFLVSFLHSWTYINIFKCKLSCSKTSTHTAVLMLRKGDVIGNTLEAERTGLVAFPQAWTSWSLVQLLVVMSSQSPESGVVFPGNLLLNTMYTLFQHNLLLISSAQNEWLLPYYILFRCYTLEIDLNPTSF